MQQVYFDTWAAAVEDRGVSIGEILQTLNLGSDLPENVIGQINIIADESDFSDQAWTLAFIQLLADNNIPYQTVLSISDPKYIDRVKCMEEFRNNTSVRDVYDFDLFLGFSERIRSSAMANIGNSQFAGMVIPSDLDQEVVSDIQKTICATLFTVNINSVESAPCRIGIRVFTACCDQVRENYVVCYDRIDRRNKLIVMVHGITSYAPWQHEIKMCLNAEGFQVHNVNYGYFGLARFLNPSKNILQENIKIVSENVRHAISQNIGKKYYLVAHSYGSLLTSKILNKLEGTLIGGVIFCGSIANREDGSEILQSIGGAPLINDVGEKDIWPAVAKSKRYGYGCVGSDGFRDEQNIYDRLHPGIDHNLFLKPEFVQKYWIPFFDNGERVSTNTDFRGPGPFQKFLMRFPLEVILGAVLSVLALLLIYFFGWYGIPVLFSLLAITYMLRG